MYMRLYASNTRHKLKSHLRSVSFPLLLCDHNSRSSGILSIGSFCSMYSSTFAARTHARKRGRPCLLFCFGNIVTKNGEPDILSSATVLFICLFLLHFQCDRSSPLVSWLTNALVNSQLQNHKLLNCHFLLTDPLIFFSASPYTLRQSLLTIHK